MTRARLAAALLWAAVGVALPLYLGARDRPLTSDNQLYFYLAERAASGVPPFVSHVDSKNQLPALLSAAGIVVARATGGDDVAATRVVSVAFGAASLAMVADLAAALTGSTAAGAVAALSLLSSRGFFVHAAIGSNAKVVLAAFLVLAHLALARGGAAAPSADEAPAMRRRRRADRLAGLSAGAAFLCWQPSLMVGAAVVVEALCTTWAATRRAAPALGRAMRIGAWMAAPLLPYTAYFAATGALDEHWEQGYLLTLGSIHEPKGLASSLRFLFTEVGGPASPWRAGPVAALVFVSAAAITALAAPRVAGRALLARPGLVSTLLAGLGATAFTLYDHQGVPDLFFVQPYFALAAAGSVALAARLLETVAQRLRRGSMDGPQSSSTLRPLCMLVPCVVAVAPLSKQWIVDVEGQLRTLPSYTLDDQRRLAARVLDLHRQHGALWACGPVHLLGLLHLDNHVPHGFFYDDLRTALSEETWLPLRDGRMPEVILQTRGALPGAKHYLEADYAEVTPKEFALQGVRVWRRTSDQPSDGGRPRRGLHLPKPHRMPARQPPSH